MFFVDEEHQANFERLVAQFRAQDDKEYKVACYVIGLPEVYGKIGGKTGEFPFSWVYKSEDEADDEETTKYSEAFGVLSSSYRAIVKMAMSLYNSGNSFELMDGIGVWGDELTKVFYQAMEIRRGREVVGLSIDIQGDF